MGKLLAAGAVLLVAVVGAPLLAALAIAGAVAPAAAAAPDDCAVAMPGAGEWRPPFVQPYTVSARGIGWSYHPVFKRWNFHGGQDMSSLPGPGPIVAANTGRVIRAGWDTTGYGNTVDLQHAAGIQTRYAHLALIDPSIVPGATVAAGQQLGTEGTTGASTGNHLHFEVAVNGTRVDPLTFMRDHHAPLDGRAVAAPSDPGYGAAAHARDHRSTWQAGDPTGDEASAHHAAQRCPTHPG
jgi:murein DD-endopeptidase MepM/ murein hydrolase activator NlpD